MKHRLLLGTAGHIDHGKTALVKALTGVDTDRLPEEKARQITIDLGFAPLELDDFLLGIVDVPGHERFVKNMLAGATGVDLAMLVVAVDDAVKPQTREHLEILQYLRLSVGVIALTKCDLAEPEWIDLVESEVRELVQGTFLWNAPMVRVSARTGEGLPQLREALTTAARKALVGRPAASGAPFRMCVDRAFTIAGYGTVVTGCVSSGETCVGDELVLQPRGTTVRVRGLQSHETIVDRVGRGMRAAINLAGIHYDEISRGESLATPRTIQPSRLLTVELILSNAAAHPLKQRSEVRVHLGTSEALGRVGLLGRKSPLAPSEHSFAQLYLQDDVAVTWGQPFVIRAVSPMETLGGGRVLDVAATRIKRLTPEVETYLTHLAGDDPHLRVAAAAYFAGMASLPTTNLFTLAGVVDDTGLVDDLLSGGALQEIVLDNGERRLFQQAVLSETCERMLQVLSAEHHKTPLRTYVERSRVTERFAFLEERLINGLVEHLANLGRLRIEAKGLALADWQPLLSNRQRELLDRIVQAYYVAGLQPPSLAELSAELDERAANLLPLLELSVAQQSLVRIAEGAYLHEHAVRKAQSCLGEALGRRGALTVSDIRELLGTTRKIAVPLCEYLDAVGFTRRNGDLRSLK